MALSTHFVNNDYQISAKSIDKLFKNVPSSQNFETFFNTAINNQ